MKILYVTPAPPFPPRDGARLVVANLARVLATEHELHLVSFAEADGTAEDMREWFVTTDLVRMPKVGKGRKWLGSITDPLPMWIRVYGADAMRDAVRAATRAQNPDVVHLDTTMMAQYEEAVRPGAVVMAPHDSLALYLENKMHLGLTIPDRMAARMEYPKMREYEAMQFLRADRVCVVSEHEREYLRGLAPALAPRVIPNGVDTVYFVPQVGMEQTARIGFLGTMDYSLNRRAAMYFAREVMPRIRRTVPGAVFTIIGRDPTPEILALAEEPSIKVTGTVEDVRPYVAQQQVMVVAMRESSGIKNKLLEAMAMGKAVVTTPQGLGGTDARAGQDVVVAGTTNELADACIRLLGDAAERERLGQNARVWALEHSWRKTAGSYLELYQEAIDAAACR